MKVFVTGGTGFTGGYLVSRLVKEGNEVTVLVRKSSENTEKLKKLGVNLVLGNITDKDLVDNAVRDRDIVYHLAAVWREGGGIPKKYSGM